MNTGKILAFVVVALVVGAGVGYYVGSSTGYQKAIAEAKATQEEVAKKATEGAAKAVNPFQTKNPLEGVTANPFENAAKKLNPFAK